MEWKKKLAEWKAAGTEPPESLKTNGFTAGYKPPAAYFNWLFYTTYEVLKEIRNTITKDAWDGKIDSKGGDTADAKVSNVEPSEDSYPVPAAGETVKVIIGKLIKFCNDVKSGCCKIADIVNNCTSTDTDKPLAANQGKVLMDKCNQLYSDFRLVNTQYIIFGSGDDQMSFQAQNGSNFTQAAFNQNGGYFGKFIDGTWTKLFDFATKTDLADNKYNVNFIGVNSSMKTALQSLTQYETRFMVMCWNTPKDNIFVNASQEINLVSGVGIFVHCNSFWTNHPEFLVFASGKIYTGSLDVINYSFDGIFKVSGTQI